jgi:hypothetical protein
MAVTLIGASGLFTLIGKMGKFIHDIQSFQSTTYLTDYAAVVSVFDGTTLEDIIGSVSSNKYNSTFGVQNVATSLQQAATALVNRMVTNDTPLASNSNIQLSLTELIRQINASGDSVAACTVSASSAQISVPTFTGNGVIALTTKRFDGLIQQNIFAEVGPIKCIRDSQTGGAAAGSEQFQFAGDQSESNPWGYDWPLGSNGSAFLTAADASINSATNSLLYNGSMELWTVANVPDGFVVVAGAPGTDILKSTAQHYDGLASLEFVGGGTAPNLTQLFGAATSLLGTTVTVKPDTQYCLNFWAKCDVVPAAGVLTIDLIDNTNTVINDDQSVSNSFAVTLHTGITTSFAAYNGFFRLPRVLPASVSLRVRLSTGMSGGSNLFIDRMCMTPSTPLYQGGPEAAIFSGSIPFIRPDGFNLTMANNRATATYGTTWQAFFSRLFPMTQFGLILPYSGSPTILDSLMS